MEYTKLLHNINQLGILESSLARLMSRAAALSTRYPQESVATSYPIRKSGSVLQEQERMYFIVVVRITA